MCCFLLLITLAVSLGHTASREVFPCQPRSLKFNVSLYYSDTLVVLANSSFCGSAFQPYSGFKIHTRLEEDGYTSAENGSKPVVFAARRANSDGIVSWHVPLDLQLNGTAVSDPHFSVNHTMCPVELTSQSQPVVSKDIDGTPAPWRLPLFYIDVFTYSSRPLFYSILVEPVKDFTINISENRTTTIFPAAPQVFYFKFPSDYKAVTVKITNTSEAVGCIVVAVENNTCPFNDLLDDSRKKGMYESMTEKAMLTVETKWVQNDEFLLVLVAANYSMCHDQVNEANLNDFLANGQQVEIEIEELKMIDSYIKAILFPILLSIGVMVVSSIALFCCITIRCTPCCIPIVCNKTKSCSPCYHIEPCKCVCVRGFSTGSEIDDDESSCSYSCVCCKVKEPKEDNLQVDVPCGDESEDSSEITPLVGNGDIQGDDVNKNSEQTRKHHLEYAWSAILVGIFYALPTTQLLIFHQQILHWSGNQDACYYNFMCTRPAFQFSAFNNLWSNACYVLLGLWFCVIVFIRHVVYCCKRSNKDVRKYIDSHGIHQHFGLYYATGLGLALEGGMGCLYHICPNNANFQFDTAFMYIICGLIIVKLTHMRQSSVSVSVFAVFISLGVVVFYVVVGIYNDRHHKNAVRLSFGLLMLFLALPVTIVLFFTLKFWNVNKKLFQYSEIGQSIKRVGKRICWKWYTLKFAIIILLNIITCVVFLMEPLYQGIASTVLTMLVMNALLLLISYTITKLLHGEPLTLLTMILPVVIVASCGFAFSFYGSVTEWSIPPAESRAKNQACVFLDFYDNHDVWHMSFACAMFFILLFILVLDDGVVDVERKKLKNF